MEWGAVKLDSAILRERYFICNPPSAFPHLLAKTSPHFVAAMASKGVEQEVFKRNRPQDVSLTPADQTLPNQPSWDTNSE